MCSASQARIENQTKFTRFPLKITMDGICEYYGRPNYRRHSFFFHVIARFENVSPIQFTDHCFAIKTNAIKLRAPCTGNL